jgi:nitrite reductase/ring-hydroxylating ferredoxin subunit
MRDPVPDRGPGAAGHDCGSCGFEPGRRELLRQLVLGAAAAWVAAGAAPATALAVPLQWTGARRRQGATAAYPIPPADGVSVDKGEQVILVRHAGSVYAFNLSCPHQNTALRWEEASGIFQCPKHHSKYQPDGTFISGRATRGMDRFALHRDGEEIVVDLDHLYQEDDSPAEWAAAVVHL